MVKKEAKKLLIPQVVPVKPPRNQIKKSFLLLFSKKEALACFPFLSQPPLRGSVARGGGVCYFVGLIVESARLLACGEGVFHGARYR
ncbi:MAG: hypothetical protein PHI71_08840 [Acidiphilium sp.]|nr:hypothetical protein [Acidiphilium sp.]